MSARIAAWEKHYPWVDQESLGYFRSRVPRARRDSEEAMAFVVEQAQTYDLQEACVEALITVGHLDRDTNAHWDVGAPAIPTVAFDDAQTLVARLPTGAPVAIMEQVTVRLDPDSS